MRFSDEDYCLLEREMRFSDEDYCLLESDAVKSDRYLPTCWWSVLPPSSGKENKPSRFYYL
jgi:hypothetical protein